MPETLIEKSQLKNGINIIEFLHFSDIMNSKSEIRRAINEKGIKINDVLIENEKRIIEIRDFDKTGYVKISHGKKKHFVVKLKKI